MYCFKKLSSFILVISLVFCASAMGAPRLLNYQGTLADGGIPVSGIKEMPMSFKICETETGETFRWNSGNITVTVVNGVFSVTLNGEESGNEFPADLFTNDTLYIAVFVDEKEILPRKRVASVPFALNVVGSSGTSEIPKGVIVMWSGSADNIPEGWELCNGENGTPDLQDRFLVGAGREYEVGVGADEGRKYNDLSHTHSISAESPTTDSLGNHLHSVSLRTGEVIPEGDYDKDVSDGDDKNAASNHHQHYATGNTGESGNHTHTVNSHSHSGVTGSGLSNVENRPPYYALCFIMKL